MINIIDYGLGNIAAIKNVYSKLSIPVKLVSSAEELQSAEKIILPGVGAFDFAMKSLADSGMLNTLNELVLEKKVPVIGICVGMQMMANASDEGDLPGLGWIDSQVRKFEFESNGLFTQLPHMGWNDVKAVKHTGLFNDLEEEAKFYFLHSYYIDCMKNEDKHAVSIYDKEFVCAVNSNNVYGVQFHPEKSHHYGVKLLENFAKL